MDMPAARSSLPIAFALAAILFLFVVIRAPDLAAAAQCRGSDAAPAKLGKHQASNAVLCLINKERRHHGMTKLELQPEQMKAAQKHTKRMIRERCFSHQCPGEADLAGRLEETHYLPCSCTWGIGENLAYGARELGSPRGIVDAWMHSPEHKMIMLNGSYRHIGIGIVWGTPNGGRDRSSATYTTDFGFRR
jgi:uncharacterized protein YkwD